MQPQLYEYLIVAASVSSPESFFALLNKLSTIRHCPFGYGYLIPE